MRIVKTPEREACTLACIFSAAFHVVLLIFLFGWSQLQIQNQTISINTRTGTEVPIAAVMDLQLMEDPIPITPKMQPQPATFTKSSKGIPQEIDLTHTKSATNSTTNVGANTSSPTMIGPSHSANRRDGQMGALHPSLNPGKAIVYALDRSGSMGRQGRLKQAIAHVQASLRELSSDVRFQVVAYHSQVEVLIIQGSENLHPATAENIACADTFLNTLIAEGSSKHIEAVQKALSLQPDVLFLLTDADDLTPEQITTLLAKNRRKIPIYPVLFSQQDRLQTRSSFQQLAEQTKGQFRILGNQPR